MPLRLILITFGGFCLVKSSASVCSLCEVKPLSDFQNKRVSAGVLWTKTDMTSRAECAARCSLFSVIKSFGYKEASGECVAFTVPLTTPAAMTYVSESGFNMYSTCAPVDGGVSAWGQWTGPACPQTCGTSHTITKSRTRTCTNPSPDKGGASCTESLSETGDVNCGLPQCPIDGGVSAWGAWGTLVCSQTCGTTATGTRTRTRTCTNPAPAYGGADCSETLSSTTSGNCGFSSCSVDGGVSAWGAWGTLVCSQTCGTTATGTRTRTRTCTNPAPAYGGADCSETLSSTTSGNCGFSSCSDNPNFGTCSSSCSGTNVVCNTGYCVCDIMYVKRGSSCVQDCGSSGYGSGFTIFNNKLLDGYNDRVVSSIQTIEECTSLCLSASDFTCITADYEFNSKTCYLSTTAWYAVPSSSAVDSSTYQMIIRNCA
ncbi:thrombospondin-1-like isoform X1 [Haliotis rufescens]|uniref:thrombospondin-1-like isoform X1 n=1 Tax=Haliotis rufescens TaxID=6454 RepID=UPI00201EF5F1|nr:thrombospondin-1-like isoform X1 [Haliotis rufescens]